jgi:hypothetical protein
MGRDEVILLDAFVVFWSADATARLRGFALVTADAAILAYSRAGHVKAIDAAL